MNQHDETFFIRPTRHSASSSQVLPTAIDTSGLLADQIVVFPQGVDAQNVTAPHLGLNGGSEEGQSSIHIPFIAPPEPRPTRENFVTLAKWKGRVLEVNGDTFRALLFPVIGDQVEKEAEIYLEDITPEDRFLVANGAAFYWSVGYLDRPSGRIRASLLRFVRTPHWSDQDLALARQQAKIYSDLFRSDK